MYSTMVFAARVRLALTLMHTQLRCYTLEVRKNGSLAQKECKHSNLCSIFSMHHVRRHGTNTVFCCKIFRSKEVVHVASTSPNPISLENVVLVCTNQPSKCCLPSPRYFPEGFNGIPIRIPEETLHTSEVRLVNYSLGSTSPHSQWTGGIQY